MVITGRLSIRDEKEPQIIVNRARPISDFAGEEAEPEQPVQETPKQGTLYLKLTGESDPSYRKVRAILNMFPGENSVVLYFADTRLRRGTRCVLADSMIRELKNVLGEGNVVVK